MTAKNNEIKFNFNLREYPLEAVYGTVYVFVDRAYLFLDSKKKDQIEVSLKGKKPLSSKQLGDLKGEFLNELLNYAVRIRLAKNNKKIREYIISQALLSAIGTEEPAEAEEKMTYQDDPLGIAIPWEEKYGAKTKKSAKSGKK